MHQKLFTIDINIFGENEEFSVRISYFIRPYSNFLKFLFYKNKCFIFFGNSNGKQYKDYDILNIKIVNILNYFYFICKLNLNILYLTI